MTRTALAGAVALLALIPASADAKSPAPTANAKDVQVGEKATSVKIPVALSKKASKTVKLKYATAPGSASAAGDFTAKAGTLTIKRGKKSGTIVVKLGPDAVDEADERFSVKLSKPSGAKLGKHARSTVTVVDDDAAPVQQQPQGPGDASTPPKPTPDVEILPDVVTEGTGAALTVRLSGPSDSAVDVDWETVEGGSAEPLDYEAGQGTLHFSPGETEKQVVVQTLQDQSDEDVEYVDVALANVRGATTNGKQVAGVVIGDDDAAPVITIDDVTKNENPFGIAKFAIHTDRPSERFGNVKVTFNTIAGTATSGAACGGAVDFVGVSDLTVTVPNGATSAYVNVLVCNDGVVAEFQESFTAKLTSPVNATLGDDTGYGTIVSDE